MTISLIYMIFVRLHLKSHKSLELTGSDEKENIYIPHEVVNYQLKD